jgi:hypothetical protein
LCDSLPPKDHGVRQGEGFVLTCLPAGAGLAQGVELTLAHRDTEITLTVTATGPTEVTPRDAVVSLLLPDGEFGPDVIQRFCEFVHFFASPQDSERWVAEHPGTFLLSVDDAYRLGQLTNRAGFGGALASAAQR